jgi:hypothetical protein
LHHGTTAGHDDERFEPPTWVAVTRWIAIVLGMAAAAAALAAAGSLVVGPALS